MGWFRRLTGVSLKSKSTAGSPSPSDPVVDPNAAGPGPSSLAAAALEAFPVSNPESQSPRASGGGRPGHRRTRSREAFGGRDDGIPSVPRSPGFDQYPSYCSAGTSTSPAPKMNGCWSNASEFGAGARSMRVRGLLDLPPLPAIGAPSPRRTR